MKSALIVLSLVILCLAVVYGVPQYRLNRENARRAFNAANSLPLVLDAKTQAILDGADRVETFRLVDFHEEENYTELERSAAFNSHEQPLDDHQVLRTGPPQGKAFAAALREAVSEAPAFIGKDGKGSGTPSCFDPGVGFRVWNGQAHVDLCVCFYCTAIEIDTKDPTRRFKQSLMANLGLSRPAFLALSKEAFPQDARLAALN